MVKLPPHYRSVYTVTHVKHLMNAFWTQDAWLNWPNYKVLGQKVQKFIAVFFLKLLNPDPTVSLSTPTYAVSSLSAFS